MTGAPVVPVGLVGTGDAQPIGALVPRPGKPVEIRFGSPLHFEQAGEIRQNGRELRELTDEVMGRIAELTGQEVVDQYAIRRGGTAEPGPSGD